METEMGRKIVLFTLFLSYILFINVKANKDKSPITFTFPEYQYKETPKNEMTFKEFELACEQSRLCSQATGMAAVHCVRECVSPPCYREIYKNDLLEEGEIDVRLNSFKGCFVQKTGRHRNQ